MIYNFFLTIVFDRYVLLAVDEAILTINSARVRIERAFFFELMGFESTFLAVA